MSVGNQRRTDAWDTIAENREILEEIVDRDLTFAPQARNLLDELEGRGL